MALTLCLAELALGGVTGVEAAGPTQLLLEQGRAQPGPGLWAHPRLFRQPVDGHHVPGTQAHLGVAGLVVRAPGRPVGPQLSP